MQKVCVRYLFCMVLLFPLYVCTKVESIEENFDDFVVQTEDSLVDNNTTRTPILDNLTLRDSTSRYGNIMKGALNSPGVRFIHNFGVDNTFVGKRAGNYTTLTGANNTGIGADSLRVITSGARNTAVGKSSLRMCLSATQTVAVGFRALRDTTTGSDNVAVGDSALRNNMEGASNVAVGRQALRNGLFLNRNTAMGMQALFNLAANNPHDNVALGIEAGEQLTEGNNNIFIGSGAGSNLTMGNQNIDIGNRGVSGDNSTIRIGTESVHARAFIAGIKGMALASAAVPVFVNSNGRLGIQGSSRKYKRSINEMNEDSDALYVLNPITFLYNEDESDIKQYGLIAEEVEKVFPDLVVKNEYNEPIAVRYDMLPVLLLNEIKKQKKEINELKQEVEDIAQLRQAFADLQEKVERFIANN